MKIVFSKAVSNSSRHYVYVASGLSKKQKPVKALSVGKNRVSGRNNLGRVTSRSRGGGAKKLYRIIDFKRSFTDVEGVVERIEYDPNRTANIALVKYGSEYCYNIHIHGVKKGDVVKNSANAPIKKGCSLPLRNIPVGFEVCCVEMKPLKGAQIARSAGSSVQLVNKDGGYGFLKLPSGEVRKVLLDCWATIGAISNPLHKNRKLGKAGRARLLGRRPSVRGVAMNPVDHPHGGGEGKTSGGRHPVSPWGKPTKGYKTRKKNKASNSLIVSKKK